MDRESSASGLDVVDFEVSEPEQLKSLRSWLEATHVVRVVQNAGTSEPGVQGNLDFLTAIAGSAGLVAVIRTLPDFIRSRRSSISIKVRVKDREMTMTADNVQDVMSFLERVMKE